MCSCNHVFFRKLNGSSLTPIARKISVQTEWFIIKCNFRISWRILRWMNEVTTVSLCMYQRVHLWCYESYIRKNMIILFVIPIDRCNYMTETLFLLWLYFATLSSNYKVWTARKKALSLISECASTCDKCLHHCPHAVTWKKTKMIIAIWRLIFHARKTFSLWSVPNWKKDTTFHVFFSLLLPVSSNVMIIIVPILPFFDVYIKLEAHVMVLPLLVWLAQFRLVSLFSAVSEQTRSYF